LGWRSGRVGRIFGRHSVLATKGFRVLQSLERIRQNVGKRLPNFVFSVHQHLFRRLA
jgi:hypothetical protein